MSDVWGFRDLVPERAANLQPLGFTERQARFASSDVTCPT
jgi:hypothetical protein